MTNRMWNLKNPTKYDFTPEELARIDPNLYPYLFDERVYTSDEFRMFGFKVKRCPRIRSHDWTSCPFAHRAEKARRRDPRRYSYAASVCPDFRNNYCHRGDACHFAHGVFEYWLHPTMYRTRACNSGRTCRRKVCFFAHSPQELRDDAKYHCFFNVLLEKTHDHGGVLPKQGGGAVPSAAAIPFVPRPVRAAAVGGSGGSGGGRVQSSPGGGGSGGGGRGRTSAGDSGGDGGSPDFLASLSGLTIREGDGNGNGNGRGIFQWGVWGPAAAAEEEEGQDIEWITDMME